MRINTAIRPMKSAAVAGATLLVLRASFLPAGDASAAASSPANPEQTYQQSQPWMAQQGPMMGPGGRS